MGLIAALCAEIESGQWFGSVEPLGRQLARQIPALRDLGLSVQIMPHALWDEAIEIHDERE